MQLQTKAVYSVEGQLFHKHTRASTSVCLVVPSLLPSNPPARLSMLLPLQLTGGCVRLHVPEDLASLLIWCDIAQDGRSVYGTGFTAVVCVCVCVCV